MVVDADLILTAATAHRSSVVQHVPLAFRRTFTMREFARLGRSCAPLGHPIGEKQLRDRVAEIADQRGVVDPVELGADDIGDPFGAGFEAAEVAINAVSEAVDGVIAALGLVRISAAS
jgi:protein-tyrosine phosphatase